MTCSCKNAKADAPPQPSRRDALKRAVFGAGMLGLRSLATGLPASFLLDPRAALASTSNAGAQFLIVATSGYGDAVNANAPGTYTVDNPNAAPIIHPSRDGAEIPGFEAKPISIGGKTWTAAAPWATLDPSVLTRTAFFHHATLTANHGDESRVLKLMGVIRSDQMLTGLIASTLQPTLGTIQTAPIAMSTEVQQFEGKYQPQLTPLGLKSVLTSPTGLDKTLQQLRDKDLNSINAVLKETRSQTKPQRDFLDKLALSQTQVRTLAEQVATDLAAIKDNDADNQVLAAPLLIRMGVSPVVTIHLPFSGDNHTDSKWAFESAQTTASIKSMNTLFGKLSSYGLSDKVTFVIMNVFGRQLKTSIEGRAHNPVHSVAVMVGPSIKAGVYGSVDGDSATDIDATTGQGVSRGSIAMTDTLATMGKTLAAACGVDQAVIDDQITSGVTLQAALV